MSDSTVAANPAESGNRRPVRDDASDNTIAAFLSEHPKMTGALFAMMLLLSQAGSAAAKNCHVIAGP